LSGDFTVLHIVLGASCNVTTKYLGDTLIKTSLRFCKIVLIVWLRFLSGVLYTVVKRGCSFYRGLFMMSMLRICNFIYAKVFYNCLNELAKILLASVFAI